MYEQPYRYYWRVLYPEFSDPKARAHWYGRWKTAEMCMGSSTKGSRLDTSGSRMARVAGAKRPTRRRSSPTTHRRCGL